MSTVSKPNTFVEVNIAVVLDVWKIKRRCYMGVGLIKLSHCSAMHSRNKSDRKTDTVKFNTSVQENTCVYK